MRKRVLHCVNYSLSFCWDMESPNKQRYFIHSLAKRLAVLQKFVEGGRPLTLSEIARASGTTNATATRLRYTFTPLERFLEDLNEVWIEGYAINDEELAVANRAVAASVLNEHGLAIAAINIAVPTTHNSRRQMKEFPGPPSHAGWSADFRSLASNRGSFSRG